MQFRNHGKNASKNITMAVLSVVAVASSIFATPQAFAYKLRNTSDPIVVIETKKGTIKAEIFKVEAPITANNFLDLVNRNFYNGLNFHRVEKQPPFVIQGGDPNGDGSGDFIDPKTHQKRNIPLEIKASLKHDSAGVLSMARSSDPNSASCQFYITLVPTPHLDGGYAVFGHVISGQDVVDKIAVGDKMTKVYVEKK